MVDDIIINGLTTGGVYALLALGFALIFGVARIINLAHTAFYMLAVYALSQEYSLNVVASAALAVAIVPVLGIVSYKLVIERIREHETSVLIATIALAIIVQEALLKSYGGHYRGVQALIGGYATILGVKVSHQQLLTLGVVFLVLLLTWIVLMRTRLGIAIRATAQDREVANLMGMNVSRVGMMTMGVAVVLASIGGVMVAPLWTVEPHMWLHPLVMVLAIVVLGGLGSIKGSFVAAFLIGFVETTVVYAKPEWAYLRGAISLSIMLIVLLVRPEGLFGVVFEEER
jgi:branched-chain amino acid transport system permease protein